MFQFQAATKFIFGVDTINQLGQEIQALGGQKAFIVTDKGIVNAGILDQVTQPSIEADIEIGYSVFDQRIGQSGALTVYAQSVTTKLIQQARRAAQ